MKKKTAGLIFLTCFSFASLWAEKNVVFSGELSTQWGIITPWASEVEWKDNDDAGKFSLGTTAFNGTLDAAFGNSSALVDASVSYDAVINTFDYSLNEIWFDYTDSFWGIRVGRQRSAWGKGDGIDLTNVLCPSDMSSFSSMLSDDSKLPVDAVRVSFFGDWFNLDAYWIPFFTPAELPLDEGNSLKKFIVPSSVEIPVAALGTSLNVPVTLGDFNKPDIALWNGEYGLKVSGYFPLMDVSLYGFYGWDDLPLLDYDISFSVPTEQVPYSVPELITVSGEYKRIAMVGLDAAVPVKDVVLRFESVFFPERCFQRSAENIMNQKISGAGEIKTFEQRNEVMALAGLDWMPSGWTITVQYYCDYVYGSMDELKREKAFRHSSTLSISKSFLNETMEAGISGILNFNDFDSFLNPYLNYSLSDQISFEAGAYVFLPGPDRDGEYGKYKDLSTVYVQGKFGF